MPISLQQKSMRTCVLTRQEAPKDQLIRLVLAPDGSIVADLAARLPGRGASVKPDFSLIREAIQSGKLVGALSRAFKEQVAKEALSLSLLDQMLEGLQRRCINRLGQAKRSGDCVTGAEKIQASLLKGLEPALLVSASDAGADGRKKLKAQLGSDVRQFQCLDRASLSEALGLENAPHVVIAAGNNATLLAADFMRYEAMLATMPNDDISRDEKS